MSKPLTERDMETLGELDAFRASMERAGIDRGARPMDVGGSNQSHHSVTLKKLAARGLVMRKKYGGARQKGSCLYWITDEGQSLLREHGRQALTPEEYEAALQRAKARKCKDLIS